MKATQTLTLLLWIVVTGAAQTTTTNPASGPAPAASPGSPTNAPKGPASLATPQVDAASRTNPAALNFMQRRLMALTNQAARNTNAPGAAKTAAGPPPTGPLAPKAAATAPATATNVAEAILPSQPRGETTAPPVTSPAPPSVGPSSATNPAPPPFRPPVSAAASALTNLAPGAVRPNPFAALTNRPRISPPGFPAGAEATNVAAARPGDTGAQPGAGPGAPKGTGPGPKPGAVVVQPTPGGSTTNLLSTLKAGEDELIPPGMLHLKEADLSQVLDLYAELTSRTILRPATLPTVKITLWAQTQLTRREAIQALEAVFGMNQITTVPMEDKFVKVIASTAAGNAGGKPTPSEDKVAEFGPFTTVIKTLKYADPTEVLPVIQPFAQLQNSIVAIKSSQILVLRDYAENIKRMLELIDKVDVMVPSAYEPVVIPIKYALAGDIASVLGSLTAGGGGVTGGGGGGAGRSGGGMMGAGSRTGSLGGGMGGMGGYGGMGGMGGYGGTGGYGGGYRSGMGMSPMALGSTTGTGTDAGALAGARSSFAQRLGGIIKSATTGGGTGEIQVINTAKIIPDERTNSLLVFADTNDLRTISNIIAKLDVVLAQVLIESIVAEVGLNDTFTFGISTKQTKPSLLGDFTGIGAINPAKIIDPSAFLSSQSSNGVAIAQGFTYAAKYGDDLQVALAAAAADGRVQVLQKPRMVTSHAKEASIFIGEQHPIISGYTSGGGYYGNYSQYQMLQIGISISILPFINSEGLVVMDIRQRVQGIQGTVSINGNDVPITSDKEATAYIAVRDRDTVILGGYINSSLTTSYEGVPFLKDLPLIGSLFKTHSKSGSRTEMVILIKPTVLSTPEAAATATALEQDNMPTLRRAQMQYEKQTREEIEKTNAEREKDQAAERKKASKRGRSSQADTGF